MGRSALFLVAAIALIVGLLTLGTLTTPEPEAAPPSTSTTTTTTGQLEPPIDLDDFSVDQIETGPSFDFEQVAVVDNAFPYTVLEHDDVIYVMASSTVDGYEAAAGLQVWRSHDGATFESLGTVVAESHRISQFASTALGLLAVDTGAAHGGEIRLWRSPDGATWKEEPIGIPTGDSDLTSFEATTIAASDGTVAVAGQIQLGGFELAARYLRETTGSDVSVAGLGIGWEGTADDLTLVLRGPLGFVAQRIPASDLGLSEGDAEEVEPLWNGPGVVPTVWVRSDDGNWTSAQIEGASWITSMTTTPDGEFIAFGYGQVASTWRSRDGIGWVRTEIEGGGTPYLAQTWGDGFVAIGEYGVAPDVLLSDEGTDWGPAGMKDMFPTGLDWYPTGFAVGGAGIAVVSGAGAHDGLPFGGPEPLTMEKSGYTLTLDGQTGRLAIESDDESHTWAIWANRPAEGVELDLEGRTITFHDRESGDELVRLTFDELRSLEERLGPGGMDGFEIFSFSPDGETWALQGLGDEIGEDARVLAMEVAVERVVLLVARLEDWRDGPPTERFEIWSAEIPAGGIASAGTSQ